MRAEADKQSAILRAEAEREKRIREAEGEAEAILTVQKANADGIRFLKEAGADQAVLKIKSLEAFAAAGGKLIFAGDRPIYENAVSSDRGNWYCSVECCSSDDRCGNIW